NPGCEAHFNFQRDEAPALGESDGLRAGWLAGQGLVSTSELLRFFRSLEQLPDDGFLLPRPRSKEALIRQLRDYLHQVCYELGLPTRIVPHQFRHTYASEMLRAGVGFPALMYLLGHVDPDMTMRYVDVTLTDLQREFERARSKPRHLSPQPKVP